MINKMNPSEIIRSHYATFLDKNNKINYIEIVAHIVVAISISIIHVIFFSVSENVVSIVVSVASIIAGLLLNLMVLVYTLLTGRLRVSSSNISILEGIGRNTLANIAFCIFCSIALVIFSLFNLTDIRKLNLMGHFFMCFFGVLVALTIMQILVNFYTLIKNSVR